ncbi:MAG TPA: hypothetical protein VFJ16_18165, partial [Longimicrobium sp.]|nr:hypothetical protein [Longimicrobium sp.]
ATIYCTWDAAAQAPAHAPAQVGCRYVATIYCTWDAAAQVPAQPTACINYGFTAYCTSVTGTR